MNPPLLARRRWLVLSAGLAAGLGPVGAAPVHRTSPSPARSIRVVQLLDMSPEQQELSRNYSTGVRLAWAEATRAGGAPATLSTVETDGSSAAIDQALVALRADDSVCALVGAAGDRLAGRVRDGLRQAATALAHLAPWLAEGRQDEHPGLACLFASRDMQIRHALRHLEGMGVQELALVYPDAEALRLYDASLRATAGDLGLKCVSVSPNAGEDVAGLARRLPAQTPAVMLFLGATLELARFAQALPVERRQRYLIALSDVDLPTLNQLWARPPVPVVLTQVVPPPHQPQIPVVRRYRQLLKELFDEGPSPVSLAGYLAGRYALEVLRRAPELSRAGVMAELRKRSPLDLDGFRIDFVAGQGRGSRYVSQTLLNVDGRLVG